MRAAGSARQLLTGSGKVRGAAGEGPRQAGPQGSSAHGSSAKRSCQRMAAGAGGAWEGGYRDCEGGPGCRDTLLWDPGAGHPDTWVVFQKINESTNQFQSTARGGLPNPPESTIEGVVVTPPKGGGDDHHKVQRKRVVVMVTTGATKLSGGDGHHRSKKN